MTTTERRALPMACLCRLNLQIDKISKNALVFLVALVFWQDKFVLICTCCNSIQDDLFFSYAKNRLTYLQIVWIISIAHERLFHYNGFVICQNWFQHMMLATNIRWPMRRGLDQFIQRRNSIHLWWRWCCC